MSGNTVTIPAELADDLRSFLSDVDDVAAFSSMRPRARMLAMSLTDALENGQPANEAPSETTAVIELPRVPGRETTAAIEAHVARTMLDMPPPISVSVVVSGAHSCSFDTWSPPQVGETLCLSSALAVRVVVVRRDVLTPNVLHVTATILYDDRGGPF